MKYEYACNVKYVRTRPGRTDTCELGWDPDSRFGEAIARWMERRLVKRGYRRVA